MGRASPVLWRAAQVSGGALRLCLSCGARNPDLASNGFGIYSEHYFHGLGPEDMRKGSQVGAGSEGLSAQWKGWGVFRRKGIYVLCALAWGLNPLSHTLLRTLLSLYPCIGFCYSFAYSFAYSSVPVPLQWVILARRHAQMVADDREHYNMHRENCKVRPRLARHPQGEPFPPGGCPAHLGRALPSRGVPAPLLLCAMDGLAQFFQAHLS